MLPRNLATIFRITEKEEEKERNSSYHTLFKNNINNYHCIFVIELRYVHNIFKLPCKCKISVFSYQFSKVYYLEHTFTFQCHNSKTFAAMYCFLEI